MGMLSNAEQLARRYRERAQRLTQALRRGLTRAAAAVDRAQVERLSAPGAAPPGSYPVPRRSGTLAQAHFFEVRSAQLALVGNTAEYALAVHAGEGSSAPHGPRAYLDDAVAQVDPTAVVAHEVSRAVLAL